MTEAGDLSLIIRHGSRRRWVVIDRDTINDPTLSFRARGILAWLLDKPDDWRWNSTTLTREATEGREAIRTALRELETAGYLRRAKRSVEGGHWITETWVYERPEDADAENAASSVSVSREEGLPPRKPKSGFPTPGNPSSVAGPVENDLDKRRRAEDRIMAENAAKLDEVYATPKGKLTPEELRAMRHPPLPDQEATG